MRAYFCHLIISAVRYVQSISRKKYKHRRMRMLSQKKCKTFHESSQPILTYVFALYVLQHYDNLLPVFVIAFLYRIEYLSLADCYLLVINGHEPKTLLLVHNLYFRLIGQDRVVKNLLIKSVEGKSPSLWFIFTNCGELIFSNFSCMFLNPNTFFPI